MHLILASLGNDWSLSASIMTFWLPAGLFVVIALILFLLFTRPHTVPGHGELAPAGKAAASASGNGNGNGGGSGAAGGGAK